MLLPITRKRFAEVTLEEVCASVPCRPATTVRLDVGGDTARRVDLPRTPYVYKGLVSIVTGETLFVESEETGGALGELRYVESDSVGIPERTLVFKLEFTDGSTILSVTNPFPTAIKYQAFMQPAETREFFATSSCPVPARMGSFEILGSTVGAAAP